jgi:tungstate transport system substrate-binding protein
MTLPSPPCQTRRRLLAGLAGTALVDPWGAQAQGRGERPIAIGVETSLHLSGLAARLATALARDTGLRIDWRPGPSGLLLPQLERGEIDAALTIAPELEAALLRQNLVHDHRAIARTGLVLVGPALRAAPKKELPRSDPAGVAGEPDAALALARIAAAGQRGEAVYIAPAEPSGVRMLEQALWKAAGPQPVGPWLRSTAAGPVAVLAMAREAQGYALVETGVWVTQAAAGQTTGLAALLADDPRLRMTAHVMRAFRVNHPAGKLVVAWLAGRNGRRVVAGFGRGYSAPV